MRAKILSIEDDPTIAELIPKILHDTEVTSVASLTEATLALKQKSFDLVLVDITLTDGNGIYFIAENLDRLTTDHTAFIFLSGDSKMATKIIAYNLGAEDYIQKPFDPTELQTRVNSKLQKLKNVHNLILQIADLVIDLEKFKVFKKSDNAQIDLAFTTHELKILHLLAQQPEKVFSRSQILDAIWSNINITDRTIDSHITHIRKKIAHSKVAINTIKFIGYQLSIKP